MTDKTKELLIVDDNPENLRVLRDMLSKEGYAVRAAKTGNQAISSIKESEPALVLLDVHLPEMNGFEVCGQIKSDPEYKNLPIIFLSALDDSFNKLKGFEAGAVDYMTKPFDIEEVKVRVSTHLKLRESLIELEVLKSELAKKNEEIEKLRRQTNQ